MGHTANHAVVVAQLYIQGECKGVHPFIIQLRDLNTHEPLKGIYTYLTVYNSYLIETCTLHYFPNYQKYEQIFSHYRFSSLQLNGQHNKMNLYLILRYYNRRDWYKIGNERY